ncbi:hypothetical protein MHC_03595 [Mycoplasma haemocanis str. Illinois]|uniref:Uncharacterized protein n=1 Tax=Mycoplasma haemocanis (strain Illinois) TaxID=1111676 RepID=H6N7F7_MYCHN|nr:hypothetical protein [Mycoplasma haemocanis]AEW45579.1 hypothetical protein MHC_03595 [Mycoplasma haemocanis str. Illinois]
MEISKVALGLLGTAGVSGGGIFTAYKMGVFYDSKKPLSVEQRLKNEEYELVHSNETRKEIFKDLKGDTSFIEELNKYKGTEETLSQNSNDDEGSIVLEKMCSSLLKSPENKDFELASKWCVLRVKDRALSNKSWIPSGEESSWKQSFNTHKDAMATYGVSGISSSTQENEGYAKVKEWCSSNTNLPINKSRKTILNKALDWCTKATSSPGAAG